MGQMKFRGTFQVGEYTCELSYSKEHGLSAEWSPDVPKPGSLTKEQIAEYQNGRNAFMNEVAKATGMRIVVIE